MHIIGVVSEREKVIRGEKEHCEFVLIISKGKGYVLFFRFMGSAQKPPGGYACAARRFIDLCLILGFG